MKSTSLDGTWELLPVDEFKERYPEDGWVEVEVPGHWQQHEALCSYAGKAVYRRDFSFRRARGKRYRLRLNGVFYRSAVYLNGRLLGEHQGYFSPQEYEVTGILTGKNTLLVEVDCPDEEDKARKTMITGVFSHWDAMDPQSNPGGIWLPVEIVRSGEVCIKGSRLRVKSVGEELAQLDARLVLDAQGPSSAVVRISLKPHNFEGSEQLFQQQVELSGGSNVVSIPLALENPRLWWTHDQGLPHLYRVLVEVRSAGGTSPSDAVEFNYGVRTFEMRDWIAYLNGRRVFVRGNNYGPGDTRIATMNRDRYERDLELARDAHMNMLRVHAHVEHPAFYELADEMGMLLWQDFPLQWGYSRQILPEALRQVESMVDQLYNHPSIAIWCMHNEPGIEPEPSGRRWGWIAKTLFSLQLYSWNRDRLDAQLKQRVEELDDTRFAVRSSGEWSARLLREGTDSHLYYGWYRSDDPGRKLDSLAKKLRFVTEFGAQSFPNYESSIRFMDSDLSRVDWGHLEARHSLQREIMDKWVHMGCYTELKELIEASQEYQIAINRTYIDRLRRGKYQPVGGVLAFSFHDPNPAIQWSVIDYWRVPKRSYYHMQRAFHPEYVFTVLERGKFAVGEEIAVPIYVVNDSPQGYDEVGVTAEVLDGEGRRTTSASFSTALPADSETQLVRLLHLRFREPGERTLLLTLGYGNQVFQNDYPLTVKPA